MKKVIKEHLSQITVDGLMEFRGEAFSVMASCNDGSIGVNGLGQFVVKSRTETFKFNNPAVAIYKYTELITNHDDMCYHDCENCNSRCNCSSQPCSCCLENNF